MRVKYLSVYFISFLTIALFAGCDRKKQENKQVQKPVIVQEAREPVSIG
ncbi:MAG: hypothetical protein QG611_1169, partial [Bacteroidota bacterium]|nr:hypothetical protein [Bacteroidota bacterium]